MFCIVKSNIRNKDGHDLIIKVEDVIESMTILKYVYTSLQNIWIKNGEISKTTEIQHLL